MKSCTIIEDKKQTGFKLWDVDNKRYIGPTFDYKESAIYFASDWLKIHSDKYNEQSRFEIHTERK